MAEVGLSEIKRIEAKVQSGSDYISLSQGALKVGGVPVEIKRFLQQVLNTDKTDYYQSAWGIMPLREKIASYLSTQNNVSLSFKNVLVTHGCMGAISTIVLRLLSTGDEVLLPEPTYPAYRHIINLAGGQEVFVGSLAGGAWFLDIEKLERARTSKTKMILFSNPSNPTGSIVSKEILEELLAWCEKHRIYLVVDESYDDYIFDGELFSATSMVNKSDLVIRTGSYSKSLSMSGWRAGFMVVPEMLSNSMGVTQDSLLNCPNVIAQYAVLYALDHPEFSSRFHKIVKRSRDDAIRLLEPLVEKGVLTFDVPPAGFYLFLKTQKSDSFDLCIDILNRARVGMIPGRAFGPSGKPFIRLCYARERDVLFEGIKRLIEYF